MVRELENEAKKTERQLGNYFRSLGRLYIEHSLHGKISDSDIDRVTSISKQIIKTKSQQEFNLLLDSHEEILSSILKRETIKKELFYDFEGSIKNLGAWGGDFILSSSTSNPSSYFFSKGFNKILTYDEMVNNKSFDYL